MNATLHTVIYVSFILFSSYATAGDGPTWRVTGLKEPTFPVYSSHSDLLLNVEEEEEIVCRWSLNGIVK